MRTRSALLAAAAISILSLAPAQGASVTIWHETFDGIGNASTKWSSSGTSLSGIDVSGWTVVSGAVYTGQKGVRVGAAQTAAVFKSPAIVPSNSVYGIDVIVNTAAYTNAAGTQYIKVEVQDSSDNVLATFGGSAGAGSLDGTLTKHISADAVEIPTTSDYMKSFTIPASVFPTSGNMYLVFSCETSNNNQNRLLLGDVLVTQTKVSNLTQLPKPTGLNYSDVGYFGFALSWNSVSGATGYEVSLSPAEGSVSVSGTTALVTNLTEGASYTVSVVAKGDGTTTDDSDAETKSVTTLTAPAVSAPNLTPTGVSPSSFTVSWPAQESASFSVRAWTLVPADVATENFEDYAANGTVPEGWTFENSHEHYSYSDAPVDFKGNNTLWIGTPAFGGTIDSVSFHLRKVSAVTGTFTVYGSTGSTDPSDWVEIKTLTNGEIATGDYSIDELANGNPLSSLEFTRLFFQTVKTAGNFAFGSFSVTGTGVGKQPSYLTGYGPAAAAAGATSVTISNPVAGETNFVEVTATGLTGRTATSVLPVPVPARPGVISVK
jgi:hypothetical protein